MTHELVGKSYTFEDGVRLEITQIKYNDEELGGPRLTYMVHRPSCIPQRYVLTIPEFVDQFGHLFRPEKD